jgi:hypothetical protein
MPAQFVPPSTKPTGVAFEWKETDPASMRRPCKSGRYIGQYMCRLFIASMQGYGAFDVAGTVDLELHQSTEGELFRVQNGRFTSATLGAIPVAADIVGALDCSSLKFEGRLENGTFSVALGLDLPFTQGTFAGPLNASYDDRTLTLMGTWDMVGELDGIPGSCMNGSWSATWVK